VEFLPGLHPYVPQEGARHLTEQGFYDIQPGSVFGSQHVLETIRPCCQKRVRLLGMCAE
jgi:hypothetical protein